MRYLYILFLISILAGCHTGKSAAEGAAEKRAKFVADSVKYEAVKDAFTKGEFVFKINMDNHATVNPLENWIIFSGGKAKYQFFDPDFFNNSSRGVVRFGGPVRSYVGAVSHVDQTYDKKKKTITLSGNVIAHFPFKLTLYEGSNKAYGYIGGHGDTLYEGWIEPLNDATIVRGWESPD